MSEEQQVSEAPELLPCPFGHVPQGSAATFGPGPYVSESGDPNATKYYAVVCPGCCSTAHSRSRAGVISRWNSRANSSPVAQPLQLRSNPRVNLPLVALRKIRDNAPTLEAAQAIATIAIEEYVEGGQEEGYYCPEHKYSPSPNSGLALCPQCEIVAGNWGRES